MEELSYNFFSQLQITTVKPYNIQEMHNVLVVTLPTYIILSIIAASFHLVDFFSYKNFTWYTSLISAFFITIITFIFEFIILFLMIQIPIPKLILAVFVISLIIRFIIRSAASEDIYVDSHGIFSKLYKSSGDYIEKTEKKNILKRSSKKYFIFHYKNKLNNYSL